MRITTSENDIKERLSVAYVTATAARAGCQIAKLDIDKSSVDAIIMPISGAKSFVALQLKATSELAVSDDRVHFQLPIKNYNDLRDAASNIPHYLVILSLPPEAESWLTINSSELIIRAAAYYGNIRGYPAVANTASRVVTMSQGQRFDVAALTNMILSAPERIGERREPNVHGDG